jgi:hypothetical protein
MVVDRTARQRHHTISTAVGAKHSTKWRGSLTEIFAADTQQRPPEAKRQEEGSLRYVILVPLE